MDLQVLIWMLDNHDVHFIIVIIFGMYWHDHTLVLTFCSSPMMHVCIANLGQCSCQISMNLQNIALEVIFFFFKFISWKWALLVNFHHCLKLCMFPNVDFVHLCVKVLYEPGIILCMRPANERRRYIVTSSLIGWAHTQNDPWWTLCTLWVTFGLYNDLACKSTPSYY